MQTSDKEQLLQEASLQLEQGAVVKAMQIYYDLHEREPDSVEILERLLALNLHLKSFDYAIVSIGKLIALNPVNKEYYNELAHVYAQQNRWSDARDVYHALIIQRPKLAQAHFNLAYYSSRVGNFQSALDSYQRSIDLGIDNPEEVYLNISVIYADNLRDEKKSKEYLEKALEVNPEYLAALYNSANFFEDIGDRAEAKKCFEKILKIDPENPRAHSRIAYLEKVTDINNPLLGKLNQLALSETISPSDKIDVCYSMGKGLDDCGAYAQAFNYYRRANEINSLINSAYDGVQEEDKTNTIIEFFNKEWITKNRINNTETPIFIVGMFRSGSTLIEQILAAHSKVTPGGERDYIPRLIQDKCSPFPEQLSKLSALELNEMAHGYHEETKNLFPNSQYVTDKRPDNLAALGFIKTIFPRAKIIFTSRHIVDNCLSVYFLRLAKKQNYATSLQNTAQYYLLQQRLVQHWKSVFPEDLIELNYDDLILSKTSEVKRLLDFLNLEWEDGCLNFHELTNVVKTASVWQVREKLYTQSSGRWNNYKDVGEVQELIKQYC